jgi:hypothetical protein
MRIAQVGPNSAGGRDEVMNAGRQKVAAAGATCRTGETNKYLHFGRFKDERPAGTGILSGNRQVNPSVRE